MCLTTVASLLLVLNDVIGDCPSVYRMMDPDHSYCAKKVSVQSLPPASADIKLILDMHNEERSNVASKDMQKMYWNSDLADIAQRYADHCHFDHDKSIQRQAPRIPQSTGQNLAMGYADWQSVLRGWADEKKDFVYGSTQQNGVVGHYTQMVKDTAVLVGCGLAICPKSQWDPNRDWPHYVCNYVTGQLGDYKPYILGDPTTPTHERLSDCGGLVCLYSGTLNLKLCQCKCSSYASGKSCERLDCSSLPDHCAYGHDKSVCKTFANVPAECPKFCGLCDLYEAADKYYQSNMGITSDPNQSSRATLSTSLSKGSSIAFSFTQCIIVTWIYRFRKE